MNAINIDRPSTMGVQIGGHVYSLTLFKVRDYMQHSALFSDTPLSTEEHLITIVEILSEYSTIPKDVLGSLTIKQISALFLVMLEIDLTAIDKAYTK